MGLVTFTVSVIEAGRCASLATRAWALARPAWSVALRPLLEAEPELEAAVPEPLELALELHAASDKAAATASSMPARRNAEEQRLRVWSRGVIDPPSGILVNMDC